MYTFSLLAFLALCCSAALSNELVIGSFNVQVFGRKKMEKSEVVEQLVKNAPVLTGWFSCIGKNIPDKVDVPQLSVSEQIISRHDLVLIQEIRDSSGTAIVELLEKVNRANSNAYSYVISDRLGRTSSKEQYCFFYKSEYFTRIDSYTYSDPGDIFEREPLNVRFKVSDWAESDLVVSGIHIKPDDAVVELSRMVNVYEDIVNRWAIENVVMMGDFNADCSYVTKSKWPQVQLRTDERFQWFIGDDDDTTVSTTDCAYDRFVVAGGDLLTIVKDARVFDFEREYGITKELAQDVSDHFPIEIILVTEPSGLWTIVMRFLVLLAIVYVVSRLIEMIGVS